MRCLRCAGAPRRPASGSELSLSFFPSMSPSMSPGRLSLHIPSSFAISADLRREVPTARPLPMSTISRHTDSLSLQPAELLASLAEAFTSGLSTVRSPSPPPDMTTVSTGQSPPTGLSPARMAAKRRCTTSQVPGGPHYERAVLFDPGGTSALGHCRASVLSSAISDDVDSHNLVNFEAQSHGPPTYCLRFARWVTPPPRKTRFRMAGQPCPGRSGYPLGPIERFQLLHPPFPGFAWRTRQ